MNAFYVPNITIYIFRLREFHSSNKNSTYILKTGGLDMMT